MIEHLYEDLSVHLYEGEPITKKAPTPPPITYLTQWKIVGNSEVHTDPYLTSWKVSGNSVVDNNTIMSCGDLGQDGKYHVKISNGVIVYDIPLDAPLRKVGDIADTIEFPSENESKALVTRNLKSVLIGNCSIENQATDTSNVYRWVIDTNAKKIPSSASILHNVLSSKYNTVTATKTYNCNQGVSIDSVGRVIIYDADYTARNNGAAFKAANANTELIYELETPTTELIDVSPFPVSPTDTYTSANVVPYSAFEYKKNVKIWSCGEYNATDGKYHILVQPQGGSVADIALTEPLRKVNNVADTIEFPSETEGKALVTRNLNTNHYDSLITSRMDSENKTCNLSQSIPTDSFNYVESVDTNIIFLCNKLNSYSLYYGRKADLGIIPFYRGLFIRNASIEQTEEAYQEYLNGLGAIDVIYRLATPTTELVDAPQIEEADSYSMAISQGGKAVEWSSFETND